MRTCIDSRAWMALFAAGLLASAAVAAPAAELAEATTIVSTHVDSISITIYRDEFALITETRALDLPAGPVRVEFEGVVETLLPQSAVLLDAGRPVAESNYRYDPLTAATLLRNNVGEQVWITRTNPKTGRVTRQMATLQAANDGAVFQLEDGSEALHCSGLPERVEFSKVPEGLSARPTLAVELAIGKPGRRTMRLSYIAAGFSWGADYVANLNAAGSHMQLNGWATVENYTAASFHSAEVQLVAGTLHVLPEDERGSEPKQKLASLPDEERAEARAEYADAWKRERLDALGATNVVVSNCFDPKRGRRPEPVADVPFGLAAAPAPMMMRSRGRLEEIVVTGMRKLATREQLADYQLYRLPARTDLAARQTKQVAFLQKPAVKIDRFYSYRLPALDADPGADSPQPVLMVGWDNTVAAGLGEPLPGGRVRFFDRGDDAGYFAGEAELRDKAVGLPVELELGRALDLSLRIDSVHLDLGVLSGRGRLQVANELAINSQKSRPIPFEFRHALGDGWRNGALSAATLPGFRKHGDYAWRLTVNPGQTQHLSYRLQARQR